MTTDTTSYTADAIVMATEVPKARQSSAAECCDHIRTQSCADVNTYVLAVKTGDVRIRQRCTSYNWWFVSFF
jgi:hypothetical protein